MNFTKIEVDFTKLNDKGRDHAKKYLVHKGKNKEFFLSSLTSTGKKNNKPLWFISRV